MSDTSSNTLPVCPSEWLLYCRPGLEADLVAELSDHLADEAVELQHELYAGYVRVVSIDNEPINELQRRVPLEALVFARQSLIALPPMNELDKSERMKAIVSQLKEVGWSVDSIIVETPDTNEGKALAGLAKSLIRPLESHLGKKNILRRRAGKRRLHVFLTGEKDIQLGLSFPGNRSEHPNGILRLKFPPTAPSRSTLKLEEAWHQFIPHDRWEDILCAGSTATDLGAAPGGWTWQLVHRGMQVFAIDNGPMDKQLMSTGMVEHLKEDGLRWLPEVPVDWLVCDMVERPIRVIEVMSEWLIGGHCRYAVFNLKLPMKKRWEAVRECLEYLDEALKQANVKSYCRARQLFHDREEVTVFVEVLK